MIQVICPVCGAALEPQGTAWRCVQGHCFDVARQGYVNLLTVTQKHSRHPGDTREMVAARRAFLDAGWYAPIAKTLVDLVRRFCPETASVLDAGCGEGYYTAEMAKTLREREYRPKVAGIDISKAALQEAAKRDRETEYAVASCFHLPVAGESVDLLLSVFAPYCGEEFLRVLKPDGQFIMTIPLENHLYGLKEAIYEKPYRNEVKPYELEGFRLVDCRELRYEMTVRGQEIESLFMMTPYYYKTGAADQQKLLAKTELTTPVEFAVLRYEKK